MAASENKRLIEEAYAALADGDTAPMAALYADDVSWDMIGTTAWSGRYEGKQAIREKLIKPLFAQFGDRYTNRAKRIIADGDLVVVECRGRVTTKAGKPYNNAYCMIYRMRGAKIAEITEYLDTALVNEALAPPAQA
jgi:ketosteroid isomerase-like protein